MVTNKTFWSGLGLVLIGLMIILFAGIAVLIFLIDEIAEDGWAVPSFMQAYFSFRESWQDSSGNEFTGEVTAWLFGASCVPVGVDLISRTIICHVPFGETAKGFIRRINNFQRKYLMRLHTYLSIPALGLGILHLTVSSCVSNPLPELGLFLSGILVATGLLSKWNAGPKTIRKVLSKFHTSIIVSGVLLVILYAGHAVMDMD
jgi:hypothetical protein